MMTNEEFARAKLFELKPGGKGEEGKHFVEVQFNPETLKVSYSNQVVPPEKEGAKEQRGTDGLQFIGKGTTKLSVQLWFDITALPQKDDAGSPGAGTQAANAKAPADVRELTQKVVFFITPQKSEDRPDKLVLPGIRFLWGSFKFDGVVDSMEESLEFFSSDGRPLRASISMNLTQQEIGTLRDEKFKSKAGGSGNQQTPGQSPMAQAAAGQTIQDMAANRGLGGNWQEIAAANQIENPRLLRPGRFIDMNPPASGRGLKF
jgi:hypothetical protein